MIIFGLTYWSGLAFGHFPIAENLANLLQAKAGYVGVEALKHQQGTGDR